MKMVDQSQNKSHAIGLSAISEAGICKWDLICPPSSLIKFKIKRQGLILQKLC